MRTVSSLEEANPQVNFEELNLHSSLQEPILQTTPCCCQQLPLQEPRPGNCHINSLEPNPGEQHNLLTPIAKEQHNLLEQSLGGHDILQK